jgi:hypothetical protein
MLAARNQRFAGGHANFGTRQGTLSLLIALDYLESLAPAPARRTATGSSCFYGWLSRGSQSGIGAVAWYAIPFG